ncbi:MAG TPA: hypothetical protein DCW44_02280 [Eubacterium sp.]|nr:hypothetical protein [Eubacterium sp.]
MVEEINIVIKDKEYILPVEYDCYDDEEITSNQIWAAENFELNSNRLRMMIEKVAQYCESEIKNNSDSYIDKYDILSYLKPEYLYVLRDDDREYSRVALMCKYKYDLEHGLAIVFSKEGDIEVGIQDIVL